MPSLIEMIQSPDNMFCMKCRGFQAPTSIQLVCPQAKYFVLTALVPNQFEAVLPIASELTQVMKTKPEPELLQYQSCNTV